MKKRDILNGFAILVAIICLGTFTLNMINGRFDLGDFRVYYTAASNLVSGGPVYLVSFDGGSGFYKYSPATLFFFIPYTWLPFRQASILHFFILSAAYWFTMVTIGKLVTKYLLDERPKHEILLLSLSFFFIVIHVTRELYLGNINILLLMMCCLAARDILLDKPMQGGILLGIVVLAKPYLLILVIPLVLRRKWKTIGSFAATGLAGLGLPFVYPGFAKSTGMYGDWIKSIMAHSGDYPGMTSLDYFFCNLVPSWPARGIIAIFIVLTGLVVIFIVNNLKKEKDAENPAGITARNLTFEWFMILALVPNLIKTDWVVMLLSAPLIAYVIFTIAAQKRYWLIPLLAILLFFYGANSDDLLGRALSHKILYAGLMGLGNFLLILMAVYLFLSRTANREP